MKNIYYGNTKHKKAEMAVLLSEKVNFRTGSISDKQEQLIMMKDLRGHINHKYIGILKTA